MATATVKYQGDLRCECTHLQSGTVIETDAPTDNKGKGEKFSPTDLLCVSLATCVITTMGIKARDMDIELKGSHMELTKHMLAEPRRVGKIDVTLHVITSGINDKDKLILERVGHNCPVMKSLHPDLEVNINFQWS